MATLRYTILLLTLLFTFNDVRAQYSVWTWGNDDNAQRGDGKRHYDLGSFPTSTTVPAPVTCGDDWKDITAGNYSTILLRQDGTLWAWGMGRGLGLTDAQLDYDGTSNTSPAMAVAAQVGNDQNWASVTTSGPVTAAIKTDGTLWTWGVNQFGVLGNGTTLDHQLPAQVGSATNWKQVVNGGSTMIALQTDGTLWSWGYGYLRGIGAMEHVAVPTRVGTASDWASLSDFSSSGSTVAAIKTNGALWMWGNNQQGELGLGPTMTNPDYLSPQRVGTDTDWKTVVTGNQYTIAIKTDGSLWGWGRNDAGQLGDGTNNDYHMPTRIGTATDWAQISAGDAFVLALKADGSLWGWGASPLGVPNYGNSPQRIGISNNWKQVSAGADFGVALHDSPHAPVPVAVSLGDDVNTCQGSVILQSSIPNADSYKWFKSGVAHQQSDGGSGIYVATTSDTYQLVMSMSGCRSSDEIEVVIYQVPPVTYSAQGSAIPGCTNTFEPGTAVTFTNTTTDAAAHQFTWEIMDLDGNITTTIGNSHTATFNDRGFYTVKLTTTTPCPRETSKLITVESRLSINGAPIIKPCQLPVTLSGNIPDGSDYFWYTPNSSITVPGETIDADKNGRYILNVERLFCLQTVFVRVDFSGTNPLSFSPGGTAIPNCAGHFEQADLVTFENTTPDAATQDFTWTLGDGTTVTDISPAHTYAGPGQYTVTLNGSCGRTLSQHVSVQPKLWLGEDQFACAPSIILAANVLNADSYTWQTPGGPVAGQQSITASVAGTYGVTVINLGCTQTDEVAITTSRFAANTDFEILVGGVRINTNGIVLNGIPLTFMSESSNEVHRAWTFGDGTTAQKTTLQHTYTTAGSYTVKLTVTDNVGCTGSAEKYVHVEDLIVTDAISPNGDGKNDRMVITPFLYDAELKVMDRAGRTVYHASPYNNDFSGQNLESDIYYYELQLREINMRYKGYVHIVK